MNMREVIWLLNTSFEMKWIYKQVFSISIIKKPKRLLTDVKIFGFFFVTKDFFFFNRINRVERSIMPMNLPKKRKELL